VDSDREISEAVRIVIERDARVDASQIRARTTNGRVMLFGTARNEQEHRIAEQDTWLVAGVTGVDNRMRVAS
jgi:osmotically-inducible protein OsmY